MEEFKRNLYPIRTSPKQIQSKPLVSVVPKKILKIRGYTLSDSTSEKSEIFVNTEGQNSRGNKEFSRSYDQFIKDTVHFWDTEYKLEKERTDALLEEIQKRSKYLLEQLAEQITMNMDIRDENYFLKNQLEKEEQKNRELLTFLNQDLSTKKRKYMCIE